METELADLLAMAESTAARSMCLNGPFISDSMNSGALIVETLR